MLLGQIVCSELDTILGDDDLAVPTSVSFSRVCTRAFADVLLGARRRGSLLAAEGLLVQSGHALLELRNQLIAWQLSIN